MTDLTGRTLGDYHVLRPLGAGGMGQVYLARQLSLKRDVALKLLRSDLATNDIALKRFQAEAEAIARISHPNIVQVYAVGEADGLRFMALEYVEGRNLRDFLEKKGPPELPVALSIMRQVAAALQLASESGVVHRDVKPENILLTRKAEAKVTDFGLSRLAADPQPLNLTASGVTVGTPLYMAPEQVQGKATDHRTDLYSFGVTCYHLLAGQPPFHGNTAYEVAMKHCTDAPEPLAAVRPDLPPDLCALVHKLMAKDPAHRYATAKDVLRDIARIREGQSLGLPPALSLPSGPALLAGGSTQMYVPPPPSPWPARVLGGLVVTGLAAAGWWGYGALHPPAVAAPTGPGLPDARPPARVVSTRERQLLDTADRRDAKPAEVAAALIDLGLLYVKERRLKEAEEQFAKLEAERPDRPPRPGVPAVAPFAAKLGRAVVLAHRDQAKASADAFAAAIPRPAATLQVKLFLMEYPDLAEAVADALRRDAENLKAVGQKLPVGVEALLAPGAEKK